MTEKQIQNAILREFGTRGDMRIWRQNTGIGFYTSRAVRFGIPGQADLTGMLCDGRRLEIEVKSPTGRMSQDQERFAAICRNFNVMYILARSVEDVYNALRENGYAID